MRIININNKYDFIKKNSLFKKRRESRCYKSCLSSCCRSWSVRGGGCSAGEGGGGRGVVGVGSSCSSCVPKVPVARVWLVVAELPYCLRYG